MKTALLLATISIASLASSVRSDDRPAAATQPADTLTFADPSDSATTRLGGSARGGKSADEIFLLVSTHPGRTVNPRPTLYWYMTADTEADIDLVISDPDKIEPVYRQRLKGKTLRGLHEFGLKDAPADLEVGVQYKVTAMIWESADDPSMNPFSSGYIQRVATPANLGDASSPAAYSQAHLWYDTLDSLSHQIDQDPINPHLRNQRQSLLRQQHVFLGFSPPAKVSGDIEAAVGKAAKTASEREEQLLSDLAKDDVDQMRGQKGVRPLFD